MGKRVSRTCTKVMAESPNPESAQNGRINRMQEPAANRLPRDARFVSGRRFSRLWKTLTWHQAMPSGIP
jgi:hypothetical protein